jgi:hypothetical protein
VAEVCPLKAEVALPTATQFFAVKHETALSCAVEFGFGGTCRDHDIPSHASAKTC